MGLKISITHSTMWACVRGQPLLYSLCYKLLFYLTNSPARNKQNKPRKLCVHVCVSMCLCACVCWRAFVCLCVAERVGSGYCQAVYLIEKPVLWSTEAGSISQWYASFLQLCRFPHSTAVHTGLCTLGLYALTQTVFAGLYTTHVNQTPIWSLKLNNTFPCCCTFSELLSANKTGVFLQSLLST